MAEVRLVDLEVIKRFSLAVRRDTVPAAEALEALDASRALVLAAIAAAGEVAPGEVAAGEVARGEVARGEVAPTHTAEAARPPAADARGATTPVPTAAGDARDGAGTSPPLATTAARLLRSAMGAVQRRWP